MQFSGKYLVSDNPSSAHRALNSVQEGGSSLTEYFPDKWRGRVFCPWVLVSQSTIFQLFSRKICSQNRSSN